MLRIHVENSTHLHPNPKSKARPQVNPCGGHNLGSVSQAAGLCILGRGGGGWREGKAQPQGPVLGHGPQIWELEPMGHIYLIYVAKLERHMDPNGARPKLIQIGPKWQMDNSGRFKYVSILINIDQY